MTFGVASRHIPEESIGAHPRDVRVRHRGGGEAEFQESARACEHSARVPRQEGAIVGTCAVCGKSGETTEVTLGDKSTGKSSTVQMCGECAVKTARVVKEGGGEVRLVGGDSGSKSSGCLSVVVLVATLVGVAAWLLC